MLTKYIQAAMRHAVYELLPDDEGYYGEIPPLQGVWASAPSLEACRDELQGALETWVVLGLRHDHPLPVLEGEDLSITPEVVPGLDTVSVEDAA